jgi:hypothetical protein
LDVLVIGFFGRFEIVAGQAQIIRVNFELHVYHLLLSFDTWQFCIYSLHEVLMNSIDLLVTSKPEFTKGVNHQKVVREEIKKHKSSFHIEHICLN